MNHKHHLDELQRRRQQADVARMAAQAAVIQPQSQPRQFAVTVGGVCTDHGILQLGINVSGVTMLEARTILRMAAEANFAPIQAPAQPPPAEQSPGQPATESPPIAADERSDA